MLKKHFVLVLLLLFGHDGFTQNGVATPETIDMKLKYDSAKKQFAAFEKVHGRFVQTTNTRMHYLKWGDPKNTPLVWIHGSFTNGYELAGLAPALVEKGFYVIAIDYYGHGLTKIPKHDVSLYHVADDIKQLLKQEKIQKAVIGGWSRGGLIATAFYDAYPGSVLGLVLEDGGSVATNAHYHQLSPEALKERVKDIYKGRASYPGFDSEYEAYKANYDSVGGGTQFELLAWLTIDENKRWSIGTGVEQLFNMANEEQFLDNILRPTKAGLFGESMSMIEPKIIYRNLQVPMLILDPVSGQDIFPYESQNRNLQLQHPHLITHRIYENTGHNIHYEKPILFVEDLGAFLKVVRKHQAK